MIDITTGVNRAVAAGVPTMPTPTPETAPAPPPVLILTVYLKGGGQFALRVLGADISRDDRSHKITRWKMTMADGSEDSLQYLDYSEVAAVTVEPETEDWSSWVASPSAYQATRDGLG
jgi:hypothetical protein